MHVDVVGEIEEWDVDDGELYIKGEHSRYLLHTDAEQLINIAHGYRDVPAIHIGELGVAGTNDNGDLVLRGSRGDVRVHVEAERVPGLLDTIREFGVLYNLDTPDPDENLMGESE